MSQIFGGKRFEQLFREAAGLDMDKIVNPEIKNPQSHAWDKVVNIFDLLI